jgi:hypothetical protein
MMRHGEERVVELGRSLLGIESEERLRELASAAGLLEWIWRDIPRLQDAQPAEPPPAVRFLPQELTPDFWEGKPARG